MKTNLLDKRYRIMFELSLFCSLCIVATAFRLVRFDGRTERPEANMHKIDMIAAVLTDYTIRHKSPPNRPLVPIAVSDDPLIEDETIDTTEIDFSVKWKPKALIPEEPKTVSVWDEIYEFIYVEEKPDLIGGIGELQKHILYPEMARLARIEGTTVIRVLIGEDGKLMESVPLAESDPYGFSKAAMEALGKCSFKPARQRDKTVKCRMNIPVKFRLR